MPPRFRLRRNRAPASAGPSLESLLAEIAALEHSRGGEDLAVLARRELNLRHQAGLALLARDSADALGWPEPAAPGLTPGTVPEAEPGELTPELLRGAMLAAGCLLVRGLVSAEESAQLAAAIDTAYTARERNPEGTLSGDGYFEPFEPDPRFGIALERAIVRGGAGLLGADSPLVMLAVMRAFERAGLAALATGYLRERPAISINKFLLRKVLPTVFEDSGEAKGSKPSAWHQDGAFLGDVRAMNVWLSLSRCGDEAPGLDVVPRRLDEIVATGTEGAIFDWSVSRAVALESAGGAGIVRPIFEPGDALIFDELFLHSTAAEPEMQGIRYAVECWFFGPSAFPAKYAPLAF